MSRTDESQLAGLSDAEKKMLLARLLQEKANQQDVYPLTVGQRGLWAMYQMDRETALGNMPFPSRIRSPLDIKRFQRSLQALVDRHASLRTTFEERDGRLLQRVHRRMEFPFEATSAVGWSDRQIRERLSQEVHRPFDLERGPLVRATLLSPAIDDHILVVVAHHIVIDFWSLVVMLHEIRRWSTGNEVAGESASPAPEFRDFVHWQQGLLESEAGRALGAYWERELAGAPHVLELATDRPRPAVFTHRGGVAPVHIPPATTRRLNALAAQQQTTLYVVLLAAFQVLLKNYTRQTDFLVGSPHSGRSRAQFEQLVGCCMNMLPLRARLQGDPTFRELLQRVGQAALGALEHQDFPFPLIVDRLHVRRDAGRSPLVQTCFTLQKAQMLEELGRAQFMFPSARASKNVGDLHGETFYVEQSTCQYDLELMLEQAAGEIHGMLRYCKDLFEQTTAQRMAGHYQQLLESVSAHADRPISQLPWLTETERHQIVVDWNQTAVDFPHPRRLHALFEEQARQRPQAIAISCGDEQWSYAEVARRAEQLARTLLRLHPEPNPLVALCFARCPQMVVAILGVLKAGGAYIPLDPQAPLERIASMLSDANTTTVVTLSETAACFQERDSNRRVICVDAMEEASASDAAQPQRPIAPDDLAYVVYTSGSTGAPKGVMIEHRAICNTVFWRQKALPMLPGDRMLFLVPYYFDASIGIMFQALSAGAQLVMPPPGEEYDPAALAQRIESEPIEVAPIPPRLWQLLLQQPALARSRSLRLAYTGGETMSPDLPGRMQQVLGLPIHNLYGPTEAAVEATWWTCDAQDPRTTACIGRPIANMTAYILDEARQPVAIGVAGELYLGGAGLARGYLGDPAVTCERFVVSALPEHAQSGRRQRLYRTGDLCRWRSDGGIEFLGRLDEQVKLRGYRIELGELDHALTRHPEIAEAASTIVQRAQGESELAAYVVPRAGRSAPTFATLRDFLQHRLPHYMLPSSVTPLTELPRTSSGKLDRARLPAPRWDVVREATPFVAPRNDLEAFLAEQWREVLQGEQVGVLDNFYELGGNSIQGAMVISRLQDALGENVQLAAVFHLPDVASLGRYLGEAFPEAVARRFGAESLPAPGPDAASDTRAAAPGATGTPPASASDLLVPLQRHGSLAPLFLVHPPGGIVICYQPLAQLLGHARPIYGIRARGLHGEAQLPATLEDMAAEYLDAICRLQPQGPFFFAGWSLGGVIAYEMAQQLHRREQSVGFLGLIDTTIPFGEVNQAYAQEGDISGSEYGLKLTFTELAELAPEDQLPYLWEHAQRLGVIDTDAPLELVRQVLADLQQLFHHHIALANHYAVRPYKGEVVMFRPQDAPRQVALAADRGWGQLAEQVHVHWVPGQHHSMVQEPYVQALAREIKQYLGER